VASADRISGAVLALFALLVLWESSKIPFGNLADPGPGALPTLLAVVLLVCALSVVIGGGSGERFSAIDWTDWRHGAAVLAALALMATLIEIAGYRATIFFALFALVRLVEGKGWIPAALFAAGFSAGTYYLFHTLLRVQLPKGPWGI
jgi:hypothetical protein